MGRQGGQGHWRPVTVVSNPTMLSSAGGSPGRSVGASGYSDRLIFDCVRCNMLTSAWQSAVPFTATQTKHATAWTQRVIKGPAQGVSDVEPVLSCQADTSPATDMVTS